MSDFKAKMNQIRLYLGLPLRPRPRWGIFQHSLDPPANLRGGRGKGGDERGEEGKGWEEWMAHEKCKA